MGEPEIDKRPEADAPPADDGATKPSSPPEAAAKATSSPPEPAAKAPSSPPEPAAKSSSAPPGKLPSSPPGLAPKQASLPPAKATSVPKEQAAKAAFPAERSSSSSVKTPAATGPLGAYDAIARSARLADLVAIARTILGDAAKARRTAWDYTAKVATAAEDAKLSRADTDTPFGNALKVLGAGPEGEAERSLACALWAHAVAESRSKDDRDKLAGDVLWLATHTAFDATPLLDRALGSEAEDLWGAIADRIRLIDAGSGAALGRGEAIVGCAALVASDSSAARRIAADLAKDVVDPTLTRLLATAGDAPLRELRLEGEALPSPRGNVLTAVLALTGLLFAIHAVRFLARLALAYRRPAEVSVSDSGVRVRTRTEMLGRTVREREHVIVRSGLVRITREVRYPRAAFYAGLLALAIGSYIGVRAFVDGVRAASPSLLLAGLLVIALGIAADFVLGSLLPGARGRVRIAFVPRTGKVLCVGDVDARRADDVLTRALSRP